MRISAGEAAAETIKQTVTSLGAFILAGAFCFICGDSCAADSTYRSWTKPRISIGEGYSRPRISQDGRYIVAAAGAGDQEVYLFNSESADPLWEYKEGSEINLDLAISGKGEYIAGSGSRVILFKKESNVPAWSYKPPEAAHYYSVAMTADGGQVVASGMRIADNAGRVLLFNKESGTPAKIWAIDGIGYKIGLSKDGKYMAVGTDKGVVMLDRDKDAPVWSFSTASADGKKRDKITCLSMSDEGSHFVAGTYEGFMYVFDKDKGALLWNVKMKSSPDLSASISADGKNIILACDGKYKEYKTSGGDPVWELNYPGYFGVTAISHDGKFVTIADSNAHRVYFFDRDYASGDGQKAFRIYPGVFPKGVSASATCGDVVYNEKDLNYREVPPGIIAERKDLIPIYQAGKIMNVRAYISNPGKENVLHLNVRLTVMPTEVIMSDLQQYQKDDEGIASKIRTISEGIGTATALDMPVVVEGQSSRDEALRFQIPPLLVPQVVQDIKNKWGDIKNYVNRVKNYINRRLPKPAADAINKEFIDPALKELKKAEEEAKKAYMKGVTEDQGVAVPIPMLAFGIVTLSEESTGAFLDKDTYVFFYLLSTKDMIPQ